MKYLKKEKQKKILNKKLLDIIACPTDKVALEYNKEQNKLICVKCKKEYQIKNGVPILL